MTNFGYSGAKVTITEFADKVVIGGDPFVAVYSRVAVRNPTSRSIAANPDPTVGMVEMDNVPDTVPPHATANHDYVLAADRFGHSYPGRPPALAGSGIRPALRTHGEFLEWPAGPIAHRRPRRFAQRRLPERLHLYPDRPQRKRPEYRRQRLQMEFDHDVVGILTNLFTQGDFTDAHALLLSARMSWGHRANTTTGSGPTPALGRLPDEDRRSQFRQGELRSRRSGGPTEPSIEAAAHQIAADRTGPSGIMGPPERHRLRGLLDVDDYEALLGLSAYHYLATRIGNTGEAEWAAQEYASLLAATNRTLDATISRYHLNYLPCSMLKPDTENRCVHPKDANWASPLSLWAWNAPLFGAPEDGPGIAMIDATYAYGFKRLNGLLPPDTFGGFPDDYYSSGYNAGYGSTGLASRTTATRGSSVTNS